jgi:type IV pilus assembly protein PilC
LSAFLTETDAQLPGITNFLLTSSTFLRAWGLYLLLVPLIFAAVIYFYRRTKEGRNVFDRVLLKVPLLGNLLRKIYLSRISLNLSTLISGGLPIVRALETTSDVVGNDVYKNIISDTAEGVRRGEAISAILSGYPDDFPPLFIQMLVIGEKTGRLESSLKNTVEFYQKEVETDLDNFMKLLEPIIIIIFGFFVGGLIAAIIMPLYQIMLSY